MLQRVLARYFAPILFSLSVAAACAPAHSAESNSSAPISDLDLVETSLLGWCEIERRVRRGVERGVGSFQFDFADRDDVAAIAMERAWQAYAEAEEPIRNPEAWGHVIAKRVSLDELRRQKRDILRQAVPIDGDPTRFSKAPEQLAGDAPSPLQRVVEKEKRAFVRQQIRNWPSPERQLAKLLLDGRADTITAAAWLYREEQDAQSDGKTMYPQKARLLLEAKRPEFDEVL
jgi:DNA-directed RNA polymerase specialized sigma24 family protein